MKKQMMKCVCAIVIGSVMATGSFGQAVQVAYEFQRGKDRDRPKEKEKDRPKEDKKDDKKDDKKKP
jgi:ribosomal protein S28E/S33